MPEQNQLSAPRRRKVTPLSMAEAGIALTLPNVTVKSVAEYLGVSIVAIYNNIDGADALRTLVAEEILRRWTFPMPTERDTFEEALMILSKELRDLVHCNPGIAQYLVTLGANSPSALARVDAVQQRYADLFGLDPTRAHWAVGTVAEHAVALAELVHVAGRRRPDDRAMLARRDLTLIPLTIDGKKRTADSDFEWSMRAMIMGTAIVIDHPRFDAY